MNKKLIIPIALGVIIFIFILSRIIGPGNKITLSYDDFKESVSTPDTIVLKVYVENSGSMDAYMCQGSNLKDAVYDFISDLKKHTDECSLYYINSKIIPCNVTLDTYIKNLTSSSFAKAGGNRANTDLREIFRNVLINQTPNTVSVLISDCILDIPESATDFFGNCQVSIKNSFNEALIRNPNLGVQIIKMKSKFDGYWFCGKNKAHLSNVERPYYIIRIEIEGPSEITPEYPQNVQYNCIVRARTPQGTKTFYSNCNPEYFTWSSEQFTLVNNDTGTFNVRSATAGTLKCTFNYSGELSGTADYFVKQVNSATQPEYEYVSAETKFVKNWSDGRAEWKVVVKMRESGTSNYAYIDLTSSSFAGNNELRAVWDKDSLMWTSQVHNN